MADKAELAGLNRVGRRPGVGSSRQAVLEAARARFASDGFDGTTIRAIAVDARVDPSQVIQFFKSKDRLFAAVMEVPETALQRFDTAFEGPDEHLGERVVRAYLGAWEGSAQEREPLLSMLRGAVVNEQAAEQLRAFIQSRLLHGMGVRGSDAMLRAALVASMLIGVTVSRQILGVPVVANADLDAVVAVIAPAIQLILPGVVRIASPVA